MLCMTCMAQSQVIIHVVLLCVANNVTDSNNSHGWWLTVFKANWTIMVKQKVYLSISLGFQACQVQVWPRFWAKSVPFVQTSRLFELAAYQHYYSNQ